MIGMDYHAQALGVFRCKKVGCMPTAGTYSSPCYPTLVRSQKHLSKKIFQGILPPSQGTCTPLTLLRIATEVRRRTQTENLIHERSYCKTVVFELKCLEVSTSQGRSVSDLVLDIVWP